MDYYKPFALTCFNLWRPTLPPLTLCLGTPAFTLLDSRPLKDITSMYNKSNPKQNNELETTQEANERML